MGATPVVRQVNPEDMASATGAPLGHRDGTPRDLVGYQTSMAG
jgi:hypothetical protein